MQIQTLVWLIPFPPLLAFFLIWLFANRSKALSHTLAIVLMAVSWLISLYVFLSAFATEHFGKDVFASSVPWLPTGGSTLNMGVLVDPLTAAMLFFVPLTCLLIFIYSVGYHNFGQRLDAHDVEGAGSPAHNGVEPMYSRFFAFLSLFAFGMLLLVVADNLLMLFVGWEVMGLCSYLLIGFWHGRNYDDPKKITPRQAAVKAFMTTRVGDVLMMLGIVYLYFQTGTLSFREILYNEEVLHHLATTPSYVVGLSVAGLVGLLLFAGAVGKSAQFPLHVWLPDAMEGPTPVSAMIHAATMVSAGVYAMARMFPLLSAGWHEGGPLTPPMMAMGIIGSFTALFASTIAVSQRDVKKVLAYSTISQLGYMIAALGIGAYVAAAFHLITHAFFKALLFLGSGSVIHGVEHGMHHSHEHIDPQDMFNMGGLRKKMPVTFWTFLIGGFALSGFPFITAGFWSKDEILADAFANGPLVFWVLALSALLTGFYTMRQISLTFLGEPRTESAEHASESPWTITTPLVILSFFAIVAGWVGIPAAFPGLGQFVSSIRLGVLPFNFFHEFVGGTLLEQPEALPFDPFPLAASIVVGLGGLTLGWLVYGWKPLKSGQADPLAKPLGPIYTLLENKYYFDELYDFLFVRSTRWFSEVVVYQVMDKLIIDGVLHTVARVAYAAGNFFKGAEKYTINDPPDYLAKFTQWIGGSFRVIQTGRVQNYLLIVMLVAIAFGGVYYLMLSGWVK
ncbi:MAG TPA: NADH-quinone oxidoreductase subunit L [Anaerolineales bacterium]|nr:NADH-quinone oxidoreductase subunit L [Anaerolineales bacterium]